MENIKKHHVVGLVLLFTFILILVCLSAVGRSYTLADFGISPLLKTDCTSLKDTKSSSPVSITFTASSVSSTREKLKALIAKYDGQVSSDSFNSYPAPTPGSSAQDSANITVSFDKSQSDFLADLAVLVKGSGGTDTGYYFTDGSQPDGYSGGYSTYSSCITTMQTLSADALQLGILTKALRSERNPIRVSLLSQLISNTKNNLQNDVNGVNGYFEASDKPSVSISINSIQK